ncbi:ATP-binding protein [Enterococcus gallinarum]|uniref:ATP-binding protein n=8 Tax=Enterococcus TaxID=1350 RepID=UPI001D77A422|nr:ATP-binding protein [Enterococcus casseliflavus]
MKWGDTVAVRMKEPRLAFPIEAMTQNFVFTNTQDVWAGYKIAHQVFPLNDLDFFKEYIEDGEGVIENDNYEYHFMNIPEYFDLDEHIEETIDNLVRGSFSDLGKIYFHQAGEIMQDEVQMNQYSTYLFVRFTTPIQVANPLEYVELFKDMCVRLIHHLTGQRVPRSVLLSTFRKAEKQLYNDLSNYKSIERLDTKTVGRLFYYFFHRANTRLPQRDLLVEEMTEGMIENHRGYLTIEQIGKTHYLSFLTLTDVPTSMFGSAFVQNLQDSLSSPIETHTRVTFDHVDKDRRHVHKMRKRIFEQDKDQETVDGILDDDEVVLFGEERLRDLNERLKTKERRLCRMTLTFVLAAESKKELEERIKEVDFVLDGTAYKLYRPIVDQLTLFNQCLIGSSQTFKSYEQVVTTGYVADLGMDLEKEVGNRYGLPLGRVITSKKIKSVQQALSLSSKIVWFFPNLTKRAIEGAQHTNGNTLIIGPPGQGKSVLVKYIFLWLTFLGQKILYVDPKNETEIFFRKALEKFGYIPEFKVLYERINFISLSNEERYRGMLDPLLFLPREQAIQTARNVLENFGEVNTDSHTASDKKTLILEAVERVMNGKGKKHLTKVIEVIREKDPQLAKLISGHHMGLGKILLGNDYSEPIRFENQINVLGTQGLMIPTQAEIDSGRLNNEQIAGMSIMEVIMKMTYIFSTDKNEDAAIIFDEAKGFEDTAQGQFLIEDSLRKGRANVTDIYLVTQAFMDYDREDKKELLSYKFAFRPNQKEAQEKVLHFFGMESNSANLQLINELKSGTCLFQDHRGRNQPIAIDVLFDSWLLAISSTNKEDEATQQALKLEQGG